MTFACNSASGDVLLDFTFNNRRKPFSFANGLAFSNASNASDSLPQAPSTNWSFPAEMVPTTPSPLSQSFDDFALQAQPQAQIQAQVQLQQLQQFQQLQQLQRPQKISPLQPSPVYQHSSQQSQQSQPVTAKAITSPLMSLSTLSSPASNPNSQNASPFLLAAEPLMSDWNIPPLQQASSVPAAADINLFLQDTTLLNLTSMVPSSINYLSAENSPAAATAAPMASSAVASQAATGLANSNVSLAPSSSPVQSTGSQSPIFWTMDNWLDGLALSTVPTNSLVPMETQPLSSASSDAGWTMVDFPSNLDVFLPQHNPNAAIFNPGQTLHQRTGSSSTDGFDARSYEEIFIPPSPLSPSLDTSDAALFHQCFHDNHSGHFSGAVTSATTSPISIASIASSPTSTHASGSGSGILSPVGPIRKNSGPRKSPTGKSTKSVIRKTPAPKNEANGDKKVGRRRGPLLPEQRKQASEIRKLRACLRCKYLKKTCDKGHPCAGCRPSHARLWQVPCTRIDIKDLGYFLKDWKSDYGDPTVTISSYGTEESLIWITHGYGYAIPIVVRKAFAVNSEELRIEWVESSDKTTSFEVETACMVPGAEGVSFKALSEYLDKHIDGSFEDFVDDHFEGTPFVTEILKTAHRYFKKEKTPVIGKALKLVLAYNLTLHLTFVQNEGSETQVMGQLDQSSKFCGRTVAPRLVNNRIRNAMADMWRELQREILTELSRLYSSVYSGSRLKNWPTIFMLASILLAVWEEIEFDCHYRGSNAAIVSQFCEDLESTPVGVIVGLFHAISQKLPPLSEWDSREHGHILSNNPAVCDAMTEVRNHVVKHESYLRTRPDTKFDRQDFDSLSSKFLSKLVIRVH